MMSSVFFLLLPLAAYSGWLLGRRLFTLETLRKVFRFEANPPFVYQRSEMKQDVETHLALGGLFRRRGELDKAVGIHQQLADQNSLTAEQRALSLLELSRDYMRAGMLDRAEVLLLDLSEQAHDLNAVFPLLLDVYQQSKDWMRAIQTAEQWQAKTNRDMRHHIAHYHCELAEQQWLKGKRSEAIQHIKTALGVNTRCVRAGLLWANIEAQAGHFEQAIQLYQTIYDQDQPFLAEIVLPLARCYDALEDPEGMLHYCDHHLQKRMSTVAVLALSEWIYQRRGLDAAKAFLVQHLQKHPSLGGLYRLMQWTQVAEGDPSQPDLELFQVLVQKMLVDKPLYQCEACGFSGRTLQWQCPSCKRWDVIKPVDE